MSPAALAAFLLSGPVFLGTTPAPVQPAEQRPVPFPEGVASPDGRQAFLRNAAGGIDAIRLSDGALLWQSSAAQRPLLAGKRLLAEAAIPGEPTRLRLVLLDPAQSGKVVWRSDPFTLPEGVEPSDGEGRSYSAHASARGARLLYEWRAGTWYVGGTPPAPGMELSHSTRGRVEADLVTGRVKALAVAAPAETAGPLPPALAAVKSAQYYDGSEQLTRPLRRGNRLLALDVAEDGDGVALLLKGWRLPEGEPEITRVLMRGRCTLSPQVQPGSRHLFVFVQHARGEEWWVFDLDTGRRLATGLRLDRNAERPEVVGDRVCYLSRGDSDYTRAVTPRRLSCASLRTGKVLWQRAVVGVPCYLQRP